MTTDLGRELSPGELAQSINLSASRLRHLFKDETGASLAQYLKTQRMRKAKQLLETTFLNVQEIMLQVGIKDKSHFVKDFKKANGLAPLQYRTQYLKAKINLRAIARTANG
jgi:transcriptional regulator GlxA family with amidase domain